MDRKKLLLAGGGLAVAAAAPTTVGAVTVQQQPFPTFNITSTGATMIYGGRVMSFHAANVDDPLSTIISDTGHQISWAQIAAASPDTSVGPSIRMDLSKTQLAGHQTSFKASTTGRTGWCGPTQTI